MWITASLICKKKHPFDKKTDLRCKSIYKFKKTLTRGLVEKCANT